MARRTIHHQHDITGGAFIGMLAGFPVFGLLMLIGMGWLAFLGVQDWFSGRTLEPGEYELTISDADARFTGIEKATVSQTLHVVNRSDVVLTRVSLEQRIYTCPAGTDDLARCNKVKQAPMFVNVELAPGESATRDIGEQFLLLTGTSGTETIRVQNRVESVEGDSDKEV